MAEDCAITLNFDCETHKIFSKLADRAGLSVPDVLMRIVWGAIERETAHRQLRRNHGPKSLR